MLASVEKRWIVVDSQITTKPNQCSGQNRTLSNSTAGQTATTKQEFAAREEILFHRGLAAHTVR